MARVEIASQAWGYIVDGAGNPISGAAATLKNTDGTNAVHWSAITGGSSASTALASNVDGTLPRYVEEGDYDLTVGATTRRVSAVTPGTFNYSFEATGIPHQGTPIQGRVTGGIYSDSGSGNIFQTAAYAYNDKSRATVGVFGQGKGNHVWGGNFVSYADTATSANGTPTAIGIEIDFGLLGTGAAGSIAYGLVLASAGGNPGAPQNDGAYIQCQPNNSLSPVKNGLKITKSGTDEPITADGSAFLLNNITCAFGINFASSTFTTNAIQFGPGQNIGISSTTGTKIGSASSLIGLYGAAPTGRYSTTGTSTGFTAGAGTTVTHLSTFTGNTGSTAYTIGDVVRALKLIGAVAP